MSERGPAAVEVGVYRQEGFDPAASAGLFVGISTFEDARFHAVPFAVDDAVDLAHLFTLELGLLEPSRCVLALAGEPRKSGTGERLARLLEQGARRATARQRDLYFHLGEQAREAGPRGLLLLAVASHGVSDQGGDFLVATDSLAGRTLRTGVSVDEVFDEVARARAPRRLVLMDACRERLTAGTRGEEGAAMAQSFADAIGKATGQVVLAGATLGGFAYDDVKRGNGVFTGAVLDGLRGAASPDERGWITARTLADFVQDRVVEWVQRNRPEHAGKSFGIGRRSEGPADSLPLAVDPERSRAQEAYRARRAAALARLRDNQGSVLKGADYDFVESRLPEKEATAAATRLLEEVEALDGTEQRKRLLLYVLRELRGELPAPPSAEPPPRRPPARSEPAAPSSGREPSEAAGATSRSSAGRRFHWRRVLAFVVVGVGLLIGAVSLWPPGPGKEEPKPQVCAPWEGPHGMRLRFIPGGTYTIGSPATEPGRDDDERQHPVRITRGFWLGETEVTQAQWGKLVPKNPSSFSACGGDCPVEQLSWFEAVAFANEVSDEAGLTRCYELEGCTGTLGEAGFKCTSVRFTGLDCPGYRLPTEAEWEVAARAGRQTALYTGDLTLKGERNGPELDPIAWYGGNSEVSYAGGYDCSKWKEKQYPDQKACGTHPVGQKRANPWGLHDMLGNVWEWVGDWLAAYPSSLAVDPLGSSGGSDRVIRGGSWLDDARSVRAAARVWFSPEIRIDGVGVRLARGQGRSE